MRDAFATGGDREAFNARRGARLQRQGRDADWNRYTAELGRVAYRGWDRARRADKEAMTSGGYDIQYEDEGCYVKVKGGYSRDLDCWTTTVFVIPRSGKNGAHWHVVFDEQGNIIHNGWRDSGRN